MGEQLGGGKDVAAAGAPEPSFSARGVTFVTICEMGRTVPPSGVAAGLLGRTVTSHPGRPGSAPVWALASPTAGEAPRSRGNWDGWSP